MTSMATASKKLAVAIALNELVKEKPLQSLRIEDICTATGTSRSAFYRLFSDKYEIPVWCQGFAFSAGIAEAGRSLTSEQGHFITCNGLLLFKNLMVSAAEESGPYSFRTKMANRHVEAMRETILDIKHLPLTPRLDFFIECTADEQIRAVNRWLLDDDPVDITTFSQWMAALAPVELRCVLDEPTHPKDAETLSYATIIASAAHVDF